MTYDEKLSLICSALLEAKKMARDGYYCKLFTLEEPLSKISAEVIHEILLKLQEEKIVYVNDIPTSLKVITMRPTGELLRATMRKNEKSIKINKRILIVRCLNFKLPMKNAT